MKDRSERPLKNIKNILKYWHSLICWKRKQNIVMDVFAYLRWNNLNIFVTPIKSMQIFLYAYVHQLDNPPSPSYTLVRIWVNPPLPPSCVHTMWMTPYIYSMLIMYHNIIFLAVLSSEYISHFSFGHLAGPMFFMQTFSRAAFSKPI